MRAIFIAISVFFWFSCAMTIRKLAEVAGVSSNDMLTLWVMFASVIMGDIYRHVDQYQDNGWN